MSIEKDIARALKQEGFVITETVSAAIDELIELAEDETAEFEQDYDEEEDLGDEDDLEDGFQTHGDES